MVAWSRGGVGPRQGDSPVQISNLQVGLAGEEGGWPAAGVCRGWDLPPGRIVLSLTTLVRVQEVLPGRITH